MPPAADAPVHDPLAPMEWDDDDLAPREVPVRVGKARYILREAGMAAVILRRNAQMRAVRMTADEDGKARIVGLEGIAEVEVAILSLCLHPLGESGGALRDRAGALATTPKETINGWKPEIVAALYDRLKEISPELQDRAAASKEGAPGAKAAEEAAGNA